MECTENVASEEYADFITPYYPTPAEFLEMTGYQCVDFVNYEFAVVYLPQEEVGTLALSSSNYSTIPRLYSLLDSGSMEASGILPASRLPALSGGGEGVLIGFIDTGIDYTNPLFRNPDGMTRILGIWDQTSERGNTVPGNAFHPLYGTMYTNEEINRALFSSDPLSVVPSTDTDGHGTFLASVAAGGADEESGFTGAAPGASIAVVKLKPAKQYLRDFYMIREDAAAYQENDIMLGVTYLLSVARQYYMPIVICIGLGCNMGSHVGRCPLGLFLDSVSTYVGTAVVVAAGNETGYGQHYRGEMAAESPPQEVELKVAENNRGFSMEFWAQDIGVYNIGFISPTGEVVRKLPAMSRDENTFRFLLEQTEITVYSQIADFATGSQLIFIRFKKPMPGIWRIVVSSSLDISGVFHLWLAGRGFVPDGTEFLRPDPDMTITDPGNSQYPITVTAYNHQTGGIYIHASRGYSRTGQIKPEIAAPGVAISGAGISLSPFVRMTGTSAAAAHAAGAAAILLKWGILDGYDPHMNTSVIKTYFIRGAKRNPALTYPNREFGYGALDLYQAFLSLRV